MIIEAMKQALEYLKESDGYGPIDNNKPIDSLRQAIADLEKQEPIGEAYLYDDCQTPFDGAWKCPSCGHNTSTKEPVYIHPQPKREDDAAYIAGLNSSVWHLSTLVDHQYALLKEVNEVCGRDEYGDEFEDGESSLFDRIRQHLREIVDPTAQKQLTLYPVAQPNRGPLTDEQVEKIIKANMSLQMNLAGIRQDFEAAYGKKENT